MRLDGKEAEAVQILQEELPTQIKEWHEMENCEPAEVEALLADELARTESAFWVVKELEGRVKKNFDGVLKQSDAEAMHAVLEAKHQLEINNLKTQLEASLAEVRTQMGTGLGDTQAQLSNSLSETRSQLGDSLNETKALIETDVSGMKSYLEKTLGDVRTRLETTLGELITYSGAEAMGGRISQELSERVRGTITEMFAHQQEILNRVPSKKDFEVQVDGIRTAVVEASLKKEDLEIALEQNKRAMDSEANERAQAVQAIISQLPTKREVDAAIDAARNAVVETSLKKHDLEAALWQTQSALGDRLEGRLKALEGETEKTAQALEMMLTEMRNLLAEQLQKLVSAEAFEARLMAVSTMLHEAHNREIQEAVVQLQNSLETRLSETVGPVHQRVSSLITFADWERVSKEATEKTLIQFEGLQAQALGALAAQQNQSLANITTAQQNFQTGLQRDWELLNKNLEELKRRQVTLEADLRGVAVVVDDFRQEQAKTRESMASALALMTEQMKAMDEANRQLKMTLPQALQTFERQTETRLRDHAQLYQAEINALHKKLEMGLTEAFSKKLKTLKVVTE